MKPALRARILALLGSGLAACLASGAGPVHGPRSDPLPERVPPAAGPAQPAPAAVPAVRFDHEPLLSVLLARAPRVEIQLDSALPLEVDGKATRVGPGTLVVEAQDGGWRIGSLAARSAGVLRSGGRPVFALDALPEFGQPRRLRLAGDLVLQANAGVLEVVERVPMEDYLASVVGAEMNPKWPAAALAAQAIVARSYAAARWMERSERAWQLHWHFGVDMAYHGWSASNASVAAAIASTRGEVLVLQGFPVLALFHASSGGRTESFARVKPGVLAPDGKTPIAAAMPVVQDDAALPGALGLDLAASHGSWKLDLPLPEVTQALASWSAGSSARPVFGVVEAVSIHERHADSGRVASVSIRHRLDDKTRFTTLAATDFRLALGPVRVRSLLWDRCVIAAKAPGYLVLEGRGFGHGCGLSQVSAWQLARQGASPEAIVARFYTGAKIERRY